MSLFDYNKSIELHKADMPFYALIMAAMRKADSSNGPLLMAMYPEIWEELKERYNAPGGFIPGDFSENTLRLLPVEQEQQASCGVGCTCGNQ